MGAPKILRVLLAGLAASALRAGAAEARPGVDALAALTARAARCLSEVRETGDPALYSRAEASLRRAARIAPASLDVLVLEGSLDLSRHRFREALAHGAAARRRFPGNAAVAGVVVDALVELGRYDEAARMADTMAMLRPDRSSYARIAYLRELYGRTDGAIEAMTLAVEAGSPSGENAAWCRVQLGNLYFGRGDRSRARLEYQRARAAFRDYAPALAGLGRVEAAAGRLDSAAARLRRAAEILPLPDHVIALGDVLAAAGRLEEAAAQYRLVDWMDRISAQNGVVSDMEMALFLADHGLRLDEALRRARRAERARPGIRSADALAWTLYRAGRAREARAPMRRALRLGTRDALLQYHAGMIDLALGRSAAARAELRRALAWNPAFSIRGAPAARAALARRGPGRNAVTGERASRTAVY